MKKSFPATLSNLKNIRVTTKDFLKTYEVDLNTIKNIQLAVDEAVTNIIKHSYKEENINNIIEIKLEFKQGRIIIHLYDNGSLVNKEKIKPRELENIKPGGLGTYFMNSIMDELKWSESKVWVNHFTMIKKI